MRNKSNFTIFAIQNFAQNTGFLSYPKIIYARLLLLDSHVNFIYIVGFMFVR